MTPNKINNNSLGRTITCLLSMTVLLLSATPCLALSTDRNQPIHILSDAAERNEKKGITIYTGKVRMDQGSMRILAEKVTIHSIDNQVSKIVATGSPAHYQQQPSPDKETVTAKGNTIEYLLDEEKIVLIENASLDQQGTSMTGKRIRYDIKASQVNAIGGNSAQEQIHMVIPPKPKADTEAPTDSEVESNSATEVKAETATTNTGAEGTTGEPATAAN